MQFLETMKENNLTKDDIYKWNKVLHFINKNELYKVIKLDHTTYEADGDIVVIMNTLSVPEEYHYITMLTNGYSNPADYRFNPSDEYLFKLVDLQELDKIKKKVFGKYEKNSTI